MEIAYEETWGLHGCYRQSGLTIPLRSSALSGGLSLLKRLVLPSYFSVVVAAELVEVSSSSCERVFKISSML
jgi:hypothetical protein